MTPMQFVMPRWAAPCRTLGPAYSVLMLCPSSCACKVTAAQSQPPNPSRPLPAAHSHTLSTQHWCLPPWGTPAHRPTRPAHLNLPPTFGTPNLLLQVPRL